jgi:hypothetical protein
MDSDEGGLLNDEPEKALEVWRQLLEGPFKGCLGGRRDKNGIFAGIGEEAMWAAAGKRASRDCILRVTGHYRPGERDAFANIEDMPMNGFSVRCVRDKPMSEY